MDSRAQCWLEGWHCPPDNCMLTGLGAWQKLRGCYFFYNRNDENSEGKRPRAGLRVTLLLMCAFVILCLFFCSFTLLLTLEAHLLPSCVALVLGKVAAASRWTGQVYLPQLCKDSIYFSKHLSRTGRQVLDGAMC